MEESTIIIDLEALAESMDRSPTDNMLPMLDSQTGQLESIACELAIDDVYLKEFG